MLRHEIEFLASSKFDMLNENNKRSLIGFWKAMYPDRRVPDMVSKDWSELGFQGMNPSSDFRGVGILGYQFNYFTYTQSK